MTTTIQIPTRAQALLARLPAGPLVGAEVGVYRGETSAALLSARRDLRLYMVDPWREITPTDAPCSLRRQSVCDADMRQAEADTAFAADRRWILRHASPGIVWRFDHDSLDFVFIDADHRRKAVLADCEAWYPRLKPGGLLAGHDYDDPAAPWTWGVTEAVMQFSLDRGLSFSLGADHTWFIHKPGGGA